MNGLFRVRRSLFAAVAASMIASSAFAQTPTPAPAAAPAAPPAAAPAPQAEAPKWPDFGAVTKDMVPMPGLFTVYRYKAEDQSKDHTKLLCQIPRTLLKQDLLLA